MTYKESVWEKMGENPGLQLKIAIALNISQQAVQRNIERRSDVLTKFAAVKVISDELGIPEEKLFEKVTA